MSASYCFVNVFQFIITDDWGTKIGPDRSNDCVIYMYTCVFERVRECVCANHPAVVSSRKCRRDQRLSLPLSVKCVCVSVRGRESEEGVSVKLSDE